MEFLPLCVVGYPVATILHSPETFLPLCLVLFAIRFDRSPDKGSMFRPFIRPAGETCTLVLTVAMAS